MNLKEAFRYQNFLENIFHIAASSIAQQDHCLTTTEHHLRRNANPEAEDVIRELEVDDYFPNDDVLKLMGMIIRERQFVSEAIGAAKASLGWDLDAALSSNKFRQIFGNALRVMLAYKPSRKTIQGTAYKFNNEGDQTPYHYDVEVECKEAYDRKGAKSTLKAYRTEADQISAKIDEAMVNTQVEFIPEFDINDTFDDIMAKLFHEDEED